MYGNLSFISNHNGTDDMFIRNNRHEAELALDLLSGPDLDDGFESIDKYLKGFDGGVRVRQAKIFAGSTVVAVVPIHALLPE